MSMRGEPRDQSYDRLFDAFDSPVMRRVASEAYAEDIGQHSWVTANELRTDITRLALTPSHHLLDLGCGPAGPLTFVLASVGCHGTGVDVSAPAVESGRRRAASLGVAHLATLVQGDLNRPLALETATFDAAMSLDVVPHFRDRVAVFREVARVLVPGTRFLFTDAAVAAGAVSSEEVASRSIHGFMQFVPPGFNERALEDAGFEVLETEDRTESVTENASGRVRARLAHRGELEQLEGATGFEHQLHYLDTVLALARRRALVRMMYLARTHGG
jgi:SAM-dependent methyltransferase